MLLWIMRIKWRCSVVSRMWHHQWMHAQEEKNRLYSLIVCSIKKRILNSSKLILRTWLWIRTRSAYIKREEFFALLLFICRQLLQIMWSDVAIIYFLCAFNAGDENVKKRENETCSERFLGIRLKEQRVNSGLKLKGWMLF